MTARRDAVGRCHRPRYNNWEYQAKCEEQLEWFSRPLWQQHCLSSVDMISPQRAYILRRQVSHPLPHVCPTFQKLHAHPLLSQWCGFFAY